MRIWSRIIAVSLLFCIASCTPSRPATPRETFITYTKAIAKKDAAAMKLLLSDGSIKMHEKEASVQGVPLDEVIRRETLFNETQKVVEFKDEVIDGDKATLQVKNASKKWETVFFVREGGDWKIDKVAYADKILRDIEEQQNQTFDELRNFDANIPVGISTPGDPNASPTLTTSPTGTPKP